MIITNKSKIPEQIYHWVKTTHEKNEARRNETITELRKLYGTIGPTISATSFIKPTREIVLLDRHYHEIEEDAVKLLDATIGTSLHETLQTMPMQEGEIRELRTGTMMHGVLVTAQFDYLLNNRIGDYKTTKIGNYLYGDKEFELVTQLSINRYLFLNDIRFTRETSDTGEITMLFMDWRDWEFLAKKYGFRDAPGYPVKAIKFNLKLWDYSKTEQFILKKLEHYKMASLKEDAVLPFCTDKERWIKQTKKKTTFLKCEKYCSARAFCNQVNGWHSQYDGGNNES